tara:strand:- start:47 stop:313 length:267 start_codon:yes stop_codon:yes gene_type:complete
MTTVNVTTNESTVTVSPTSNSVTVTQGEPSVVTIGVLGPAGPSFSSTGKELLDSGVVNNSVIYYDSTSATFKADATRTVENLVDGGSF